MYIPINFLASSLSCANTQLSGSVIPNDHSDNYERIGSGSDDAYFVIRTDVGESVTFNINGGITNAKLLLVGGGGRADRFNQNPLSTSDSSTGGGGAGGVIFQDVTLQPGIDYFMSSSATGGTSANPTGGSSTFIQNYVPDPVDWTQLTAEGGEGNDTSTGGDSADGFSGGTGLINGAGGGGGGSTGNGEDYQIPPGLPGARDGGDGGDGYTIPSPFNSVAVDLNTKIAGGGPGDSYQNSPGTYASGVGADNYGNGASGAGAGNNNGNPGVAFLFIPISSCELTPTGSIILPEETPNAIGGDIVGTFTSSSRDYRYHLFTQESGYLNFNTGSTTEAKMLLVAGGAYGGGVDRAGGGGAGGVAIKRNQPLYGTLKVTAGPAGLTGNTRGRDSVVTSISNYIYQVRAIGGGRGATFSRVGEDGGSGGGGYGSTAAGGSINCTDTSFCTADEYYGNDGGNGFVSGISYGGGGGGAGSVGENGGTTTGLGGSGYTLTDEFFPPAVLFSSSSIARGGSRRGLSQGYVSEVNSGDGEGEGSPARQGFVCITYPIS